MPDTSIEDLTGTIFSESHGAGGSDLGAGWLYFSLTSMLQAQVCVCIGSGGGFVPKVMRSAQRNAALANAYTYLVDANIAELGFGHPMQPGGWLAPGGGFDDDPGLIVVQGLSHDAAALFAASGVAIDYLHVDGDHSRAGVVSDLDDFLPLLSPHGVISMHDLRLSSVRQAMRDIGARHPDLESVVFDEIGNGTAIVRRRAREVRPALASRESAGQRRTRIDDKLAGTLLAESRERSLFTRWDHLCTPAYKSRYRLAAPFVDLEGSTVVELGGFPNSICEFVQRARTVIAIEAYAPPDYVERVRSMASARDISFRIFAYSLARQSFDAVAAQPYSFVALGLDLSGGCSTMPDFAAALENLLTLIAGASVCVLDTADYIPSHITGELIARCVEQEVILDVALDLSRDPIAEEFFVKDSRAQHRMVVFRPKALLAPAMRRPLVEASARRLASIKSPATRSRHYTFGDRILFRNGEATDRFLVSGWYRLEREHVWSSGKVSRLAFKLADMSADTSRLTLSVHCRPFLGAGRLAGQRLSIVANGRRVFKGTLTRPGAIRVELDRRCVGDDGLLRLAIVHPDGASPQRLGLSGDDRCLAVALTELSIEAA